MELVPLLVPMAAFAVVTGVVAQRKGRRVWLWALLGAAFTLAALIIVAVLPGTRERGAGGHSLPDGADHESRLRARVEGAKLRRQVDNARSEARHPGRRGWFGGP